MNNNSSFSHRREEPESGVLYLVGTPIGNLNDISSRAINILKNVSIIACEDTRQTKKITSRFDINNKLISFNKYNSITRIPKIINLLKEGKSVALVSDAGMPSVCDPGEDLVINAKTNNLETICVPGPSAALTALGIDRKEYENKLVYLMSVEKARFRSPVIPDCELNLEIEAIRSHGRVWKYKGIAKVNEKKMADAEWSATIVDRNKQ